MIFLISKRYLAVPSYLFYYVQEFTLTNERFLVPEMLFRPSDLGKCCILIINDILIYSVEILLRRIKNSQCIDLH